MASAAGAVICGPFWAKLAAMENTFDGQTPLVSKETLVRLRGACDRAGLIRLGQHVGALLAAGLAVHATAGTVFVAPAMLAYAIVFAALFAGLHESIHRTAFRSRWLNDIIARVIGFLLFLPASHFRRFHFAHHRFTQDRARDPELARPKPATIGRYIRHVLAVDHWFDRAHELFAHARGRVTADFVPRSERAAVIREARLHVLGYAAIAIVSIAAGSAFALVWWVLPVLLGQPFLRLYLLAEHTGCPFTDDMRANTRTVLTTPLIRFLMWNMPYHAEHHIYPGVPFFRLADLHEEIRPALRVVEPGYGRFHATYLAALRNERGAAFAGADG